MGISVVETGVWKVILSSISPNNNFNNCPQKVMYTAFAKQDNCYDGFIYLKWRMQYISLLFA